MIMIPDTETTLLRGGKMYEEGNEKSVKPGFGVNMTARRSRRASD